MINNKGYMVSFLYKGGIACPGFLPRRWWHGRQSGKEQMKLETA
jgi:hypothetical protein